MGKGLARRGVIQLGWLTSIGMFVVLVMGATVTSTGSAQGCGREWPLCQGKFIPDFALATAIEFSHRAVTGVEGVLVVVFTIGVLAFWGRRPAVRVLTGLMFGFLVLQAGMGAWAVKYPQQPVVLALHFGISLVALASTVLTAVHISRADLRIGSGPIVSWAKVGTWGLAVYFYLLVYSGAYVRHVGAAGACQSWPLCGDSAGSAGALAVNLVHRIGAGLLLAFAVLLLLSYRRLRPSRPDLVAWAWVALAAMVLEGMSGAYLVGSRWSLGGELLHAALTGVTFTAIALLCLLVTLNADRISAPVAEHGSHVSW